MKKFWLSLAFGLLAFLSPAEAQMLLPNGQQQFTDSNGVPLAGGTVYFYVPGTTTPKTTYQDPLLTVPNTNPVVLNAAGRATVWGKGTYREIVYDSLGNLIWDQQTSGLLSVSTSTANGFGAQTAIPSAGTTDLGTITTQNVLITGNTTINSFGSSANVNSPVYLIQFQNAITLTYNAVSMILPGNKNFTTNAGDEALAIYLGSGNWEIVLYTISTENPTGYGFGPQTSIVASAGVIDLGSSKTNNVLASGTGPITSFGTTALTAQPVYLIQFGSSLTLTYNATSMILPGASNITTQVGSIALAQYLGTGNWRVFYYTTPSGSVGGGQLQSTTLTANGTYAFSANTTPTTHFALICVGGGGGGGSNAGGNGGGGGGGGSGATGDFVVEGFTPSTNATVTIGPGGAGSTSSGSAGSNGTATTFVYNGVTVLSCAGGTGGTSGSTNENSGGPAGAVTTNFTGLTLVDTIAGGAGGDGGNGAYLGGGASYGGEGGSNPLGQGGRPTVTKTAASGARTGHIGQGYGAGGGGGASDGSQSTGGAGTSGAMLIQVIQ